MPPESSFAEPADKAIETSADPASRTELTLKLRNRARLDNLDVDDEIIQFIAEHVVSNIRELEGSLTRVVAYSQLRRRPLTLELTIEALRDLLPDVKKKEVTPQGDSWVVPHP